MNETVIGDVSDEEDAPAINPTVHKNSLKVRMS